jgi:hypothetical protein
MEKLPHYHFSCRVSFQKLRYHVCEMLGGRRGYSHLKEEALSIALSGGIVLEEALDLSSDRLLMMMM